MQIRPLNSLFSTDLAVDLGTANTLIFANGRGVVVDEPSVVAVNRNTGAVEAVGKSAKEMLGRTPEGIAAVCPVREGVIADFKMTEQMLAHFIRQAHQRRGWVRPRIVVGVPSEITPVEKRAVVEAASRARASEVYLVEQAMVAAVGAGLPVAEPIGSMVVDIGGGTTDIAVVSLSGIVYSRSVRTAGNVMDEAIAQHVKREYNLLIGDRTAEQIKISIGSAAPLRQPLLMDVKGRDIVGGLPRTVRLRDGEIREALTDSVSVIIRAIRTALEATPPELSGDIADRGLVLTGGVALLRNLDTRISQDIGVPVSVAESPLSSVVLGISQMLGNFKTLRRITLN